MLRHLDRAGDTIVEVMVVLAVLGLAISVSYATANRSLLGARAAQESSQASAILLGQTEGLRVLAKNNTTSINNIFLASGTRFCIDIANIKTTDPAVKLVKGTGSGTYTFSAGDLGDYATYPHDDAKPAVLSPCVYDMGAYKIYVSITAIANDGFTLRAVWDDVQQSGQAGTSLIYRVHRVVQ